MSRLNVERFGHFLTREGRQKFIQFTKLGIYESIDANEDKIVMSLSQQGRRKVLEILTYQPNGWIAATTYSEDGQRVASTFNGRWETKEEEEEDGK